MFLSCDSEEIVLDKEVVAYIYDSENTIDYNDFDSKKFTRLNFAFLNSKNSKVVFDKLSDKLQLRKVNNLKNQNDKLDVFISVKFFNWLNTISKYKYNSKFIETFTQSITNFLEHENLEGVDLYFEIPKNVIIKKSLSENLSKFIKNLKNSFDSYFVKHSKELKISLTIGIDAIDKNLVEFTQVQQYLHSLNIITYDFFTGSEKNTGHISNIFSSEASPKKLSVDSIVRGVISKGVDNEKLVIGIPFYRMIWSEVDSLSNGLYQKALNSQMITNEKIDSMINARTLIKYWDDQSKAAYYWDNKEKVFISAEDSRTIKYKCDYAKLKKLQGIFFWAYNKGAEVYIDEINYWLKK
jgi:chitinase